MRLVKKTIARFVLDKKRNDQKTVSQNTKH